MMSSLLPWRTHTCRLWLRWVCSENGGAKTAGRSEYPNAPQITSCGEAAHRNGLWWDEGTLFRKPPPPPPLPPPASITWGSGASRHACGITEVADEGRGEKKSFRKLNERSSRDMSSKGKTNHLHMRVNQVRPMIRSTSTAYCGTEGYCVHLASKTCLPFTWGFPL